MATLSLSLPDELKSWIDDQVRRRGYAGAAEYVRELIRKDRKTLEEDALERLLIEGLESGPGRELTDADWEALEARVRRKAGKKRAR